MMKMSDLGDGDECDELVEEVGAMDVDGALGRVGVLDLADELSRARMVLLRNEEVEPAKEGVSDEGALPQSVDSPDVLLWVLDSSSGIQRIPSSQQAQSTLSIRALHPSRQLHSGNAFPHHLTNDTPAPISANLPCRRSHQLQARSSSRARARLTACS